MSLRIVAGSAKGQVLRGPKQDGIRPAAARVRKSIFDILGDLSGQQVLDLFAGTGSMGLEALSRGAESTTFVDPNPHAIDLLRHNLGKTNFLEKSQLLKKPALSAIEWLRQKQRRFDLIFLDPPYDQNHLNPCLKKIAESDLLAPEALLLCEHSPRELPQICDGLREVDQRKYGQTLVSFFQRVSA